jgi:hypothetical protein
MARMRRGDEAEELKPNTADRIHEIRVIRGKKDWDWGSEPKPRSLTADRTDGADAEGRES